MEHNDLSFVGIRLFSLLLFSENNNFAKSFKFTTDTNNHYHCMTKHILPYNFNICYGIYLKLTGES